MTPILQGTLAQGPRIAAPVHHGGDSAVPGLQETVYHGGHHAGQELPPPEHPERGNVQVTGQAGLLGADHGRHSGHHDCRDLLCLLRYLHADR
ncbi:hypothetical protein E2C01_082286 [Portunus trituberculatus]|uniref:Uncharacterized protein n=1 Tax=Portunus trituberculatus TaxID=210409 RepID=A0A5B7IY18_PORTR|nr:hypothetical protein [Portunus trituberculatus]